EQLLRERLCARIEREDDVVAAYGRAAELVERALKRVAQVRVRAGEVVVQRLLEPGLRVGRRRVSDGLRRKPVLGVTAEEQPLPGDALRPVHREPRRAVVAEDEPARDL